ncbi:hypothetical protein AB0B04_19545 [Streptomyces xinghaiensis]|uniref:Uncharacterized protein n=2 Tax=Streptomyces TaxID=1883 RepID=A0A3R7IZG4_9ACTN|nr:MULTISPECIES: hypothetical protein [Streptomyces]KNE83372.1 hypothetical protein ADZ36_06025 [Streptomyces fradiae]OFA34147.1 hypothetical protein BEN35_30885 [Streptomyces fradiae]PQM20538.1 hypothetical protein Sfr7A_25385 [Streptomyces xinghaiensis]RKM92480.1 hypothetical protein SFRA_024040 [Streptomyces xinghaiensis]RNC70447.1 hypothetical protein DC095_025030 [Streptomyces xinghaiensis]
MIDSMTRPGTVVTVAGLIEDLEGEDDRRGPEQDETENLWFRVILPHRSHLAPYDGAGLQQCAACGGYFGVTFWTCDACQNLSCRLVGSSWTGAPRRKPLMAGRPPLPVRPTPHERDGRTQHPEPARPHPQTPH